MGEWGGMLITLMKLLRQKDCSGKVDLQSRGDGKQAEHRSRCDVHEQVHWDAHMHGEINLRMKSSQKVTGTPGRMGGGLEWASPRGSNFN